MGFFKNLFGGPANQHAAEIAKRVDWLDRQKSSGTSKSVVASSSVSDDERKRAEARARVEADRRYARAAQKREEAENGLRSGTIDRKKANEMKSWADAEERYAQDALNNPK